MRGNVDGSVVPRGEQGEVKHRALVQVQLGRGLMAEIWVKPPPLLTSCLRTPSSRFFLGLLKVL